jgi:hypothetical protein
MSDRARRSSRVETNNANHRADGKRESGATSEIAIPVRAKRQAADGQSGKSHGPAEDRSGGIPPYCEESARRLTRMARVEFHTRLLLHAFGHLICGDGKRHLTAPTVRFLVCDRARGIPWVRHGDRPWCTGSRRGVPCSASPVRTPAVEPAQWF